MKERLCAQCRNGETEVPAEFYVTGRTVEGRPYRAYLCSGHVEILLSDGYQLQIQTI